MDRLLLRLPIFGDIIRRAVIARWSRTLSTMFAAGVPWSNRWIRLAAPPEITSKGRHQADSGEVLYRHQPHAMR